MKKDKKLIQYFRISLILALGINLSAHAEEVAVQAGYGNFVPVVSADRAADVRAQNNVVPSQPDSENAPVLGLPSANVAGTEKEAPSVKEVLGGLGLNEAETQIFLNYTESALQSIDKVLKTQTVSAESYEAVAKQFESLSEFASRHSDNQNVLEAVTAVISAFFEKMEKETAAPAGGSSYSALPKSENLLQDLLDYENDEKDRVGLSADSSPVSGTETVDSSERAKQREQVMEQVLEILRKGAVDSQSPAVSRAIYRSWYLSVSKRARDLRFSRLRAMMLRQQNAETPAPAI